MRADDIGTAARQVSPIVQIGAASTAALLCAHSRPERVAGAVVGYGL
jgi:hypothetical protein